MLLADGITGFHCMGMGFFQFIVITAQIMACFTFKPFYQLLFDTLPFVVTFGLNISVHKCWFSVIVLSNLL